MGALYCGQEATDGYVASIALHLLSMLCDRSFGSPRIFNRAQVHGERRHTRAGCQGLDRQAAPVTATSGFRKDYSAGHLIEPTGLSGEDCGTSELEHPMSKYFVKFNKPTRNTSPPIIHRVTCNRIQHSPGNWSGDAGTNWHSLAYATQEEAAEQAMALAPREVVGDLCPQPCSFCIG